MASNPIKQKSSFAKIVGKSFWQTDVNKKNILFKRISCIMWNICKAGRGGGGSILLTLVYQEKKSRMFGLNIPDKDGNYVQI